MGLPQEVVDRIMDMLQDDMRALKACSLTCKAMFASTQHSIHLTLRLTREAKRKAFTPEEEQHYVQGDCHGFGLRFLSSVGERDLLKYVRSMNISIRYIFPLTFWNLVFSTSNLSTGSIPSRFTHTTSLYGVTSATRTSHSSILP